VNLTQNDLMVAVALTYPIAYSGNHDQIFPHFQVSDSCRFISHSRHEPASSRQYGVHSAYGQIPPSGGLWGSGRIGSIGLAKALGRIDISGTCHFRHRNRIRATFHGAGPNRITRRHPRQSIGRGNRTHYFPFFLDTTPTLKRRFPCAA